MDVYKISICIPAYKRIDFLKRLLQSIAIQTFKDFEVVVTDDSSDGSVATLVDEYRSQFIIQYHKNPRALGTPANWNAAIRLAKGEWIKLMHDDDWFTDENSLQQFALAATNAHTSFIFSGFYKVDLEHGQQHQYVLSPRHAYLLKKNPYNILARNYIGHPSTTLVKNDQVEWYDEQLKWVVDVEYYSRLLKKHKPFNAILQPLVCLGMSSHQVTNTVFRKPEIEIPENLYLLHKMKPVILKSVLVYDYFWRFIRNLHIRDLRAVEKYRASWPIPVVIKILIRHQRYIPARWLFIGPISKMAMLFSYLYCRFTGRLNTNTGKEIGDS